MAHPRNEPPEPCGAEHRQGYGSAGHGGDANAGDEPSAASPAAHEAAQALGDHACHDHGARSLGARRPETTPCSHEHDAHEHGAHAHGRGAPFRALAIALALTVSFMGVEIAAGYWSGSLVLLADAGHMFADGGSLALALVAQRWAARPRTLRATFGHRRAEVLAAFVNGLALVLMAVWIVVEAVGRWGSPHALRGDIMLVTAVVGLGVNALAAVVLARAEASSMNVRAALAHVLTDALGSVAAILAGVAVVAFDWDRADAALSLVVAAIVAHAGWRVVREATAVLLEAAPAGLDVAAVEKTVLGTPGVASLHDLHVWRIVDSFDACTVHVVLERGAHGVAVAAAVVERLRQAHGLEHATVQPEAAAPEPVVPLRRSAEGRRLGSG